MNRKSFILGLAAAVLLLSCGKRRDPNSSGSQADSATAASILAHVPADTPYLIARLDRGNNATARLTETWLEQIARTASQFQFVVNERPGVLDESSAGHRLLRAVSNELDGKVSLDGLRSLGFDLTAPYAFFGLGLYPAGRFVLSDAKTARATIERILAGARVNAQLRQHAGRPYWRFDLETTEHLSLLVAIDQDQLSVALIARDLLAAAVPLVVGAKRPITSLADSGLAEQMQKRYQLLGDGIGLLDPPRILALIVGDDRASGATASQFPMDFGETELSQECLAASKQVVGSVPRIVWGAQAMSATSLTGSLHIEIDQAIGAKLSTLAAAMPDLEASSAPFVLGVGVSASRALDLTVEAVEELRALVPCGYEPKDGAEVVASIAAMRPMLGNFRGAALAIYEWSGTDGAETVKMLVGVIVDDAERLRSFLTSMVGISLPPPGDPAYPLAVPLPHSKRDFGKSFAILTDGALGLSTRFETGEPLREFLARSSSSDKLLVMRTTAEMLDRLDPNDLLKKEVQGRTDPDGDAMDPELAEIAASLDEHDFKDMALEVTASERALTISFALTY